MMPDDRRHNSASVYVHGNHQRPHVADLITATLCRQCTGQQLIQR